MKFSNISTIIIIIIINLIGLIKCNDHNVCSDSIKECVDENNPCKWSVVCKDITSKSDISFSNLQAIYIEIDNPKVQVEKVTLFESKLFITSTSNYSFIVTDKFEIQQNGALSVKSMALDISNLENSGSFVGDQQSTIKISSISSNHQFSISNSNILLTGDEISFETQPEFIDSNVEINAPQDQSKCTFSQGIKLESTKSLSSSMVTFINTCKLSKSSTITSITQKGSDPLILDTDSAFSISGSFSCLNDNFPCIKTSSNSNILFKLDGSLDYSSNDLNLDISNIELGLGAKITIGGDEIDNDVQYNLVKLSKVSSLNQLSGLIYLSSISNLYQLSDINYNQGTNDIVIEDSTTTEIKNSKIHNLQVHSGGNSKLLISESSINNGQVILSDTNLEIGDKVTIENSEIITNMSSSILVKSRELEVYVSNITTDQSVRIENTEYMYLENSNITIKNKNNLISQNSFIQPTGSSNFILNYYYLNGSSKLEVDHSNHASNFTIFGHLTASPDSIIGLKQLGKLSPHLIVTGNLTAGGCTLEILFNKGTEDLHAQYTILESNYFVNDFNQISVSDGDVLIDRDYYELVWRGKFCYLLNDVETDKDFAKSTINGWTIIATVLILVLVVLLFSFYKFYKNKFKKVNNNNKYEPLEMTDLEKI